MTGGWLFGYIEALKLAGIKTILICISSTVTVITRKIHQPTGAIISLLPAGKIYLSLSRSMVYPYGCNVKETFGDVFGLKKIYCSWLRQLSPYLATPLIRLAQEIHYQKCQAILCQEYEYPRFDVCVLLGKLTRIPVFATFQGGNFQIWQLEKYIRPLTIRACSGLIIASQPEIERVKCHYNISATKIAQIFNPLDLNFWKKRDCFQTRSALGIPLNSRVIIYHGRIERYRKGLDILLSAWQQICQSYGENDLCLLLVGTGNDVEWLEKAIRRSLPLSAIAKMSLKNIIWINQYILDRSLIVDYLSTADIYILPSRHEGFPVAPLEAMACSLPVIATDVFGMEEILAKQEQHGGIIMPKNDISALVQALHRLIDNDTLRYQLGKKARHRLENAFSLKVIGKQLQQFIAPKLNV